MARLALSVALLVLAPSAGLAATIPDLGVRVSGPPAEAAAQMEAARAAGVRWVSLGASWQGLEPERPGTDTGPAWDALEANVRLATSRRLRVYLVVTNAPAWASGLDGSDDPPRAEALDEYGDLLGRLARRFRGRIHAYSPWNEPNLPLFWRNPDPVAYTALQRVAYRALRAADPRAAVLSAPIAGGSRAARGYLARAYGAGLRGSADAIAWNIYPLGPPETGAGTTSRPATASLAAMRALRRDIDRRDPGRPIWLTELGWSTCTPGCSPNRVSEALQAEYLVRSIVFRRRYLQGSVERVFWYEMRDLGPDSTRWEQRHGLLRLDRTPKPAYRALARLRAPSGTPGTGLRTARQAVPRPPRASLSVGAPPSGRVAGTTVALGPMTARVRAGRLRADVRVEVTGGQARIALEGFTTRWRRIALVPSAGRARLTVRAPDRGYLAVRARAFAGTGARPVAGRAAPVTGP